MQLGMQLKRARGFTIVELAIVMAIMSILAAIAITNYNQYVGKARRSDAKSALLSEAQRAERYFTQNMTYVGFTLASANSPDRHYTIGICNATGAAFTLTANAYTFCATPTGAQSGDSCGIMSINQQGVRTPTTGCW